MTSKSPTTTDATSAGFSLEIQNSSLFFFNGPNIGWRQDRDPPLDQHIPSLVEQRLTDLGDKYCLVSHAYNMTVALTVAIAAKYDPSTRRLKVGKEYWDLLLYANYFLFEARSVLDILAVVLHYLYGKKTPRSFNDLKIAKGGKHSEIFRDAPDFLEKLVATKAADWMSSLTTENRVKKQSLRDRAAHETVARISVVPDESGKLIFRIHANRGGAHPFLQTRVAPELIATFGPIQRGVAGLLAAFKQHYPQGRIRTLIGIDEHADGLFSEESE